jgi:hypothetical protein
MGRRHSESTVESRCFWCKEAEGEEFGVRINNRSRRSLLVAVHSIQASLARSSRQSIYSRSRRPSLSSLTRQSLKNTTCDIVFTPRMDFLPSMKSSRRQVTPWRCTRRRHRTHSCYSLAYRPPYGSRYQRYRHIIWRLKSGQGPSPCWSHCLAGGFNAASTHPRGTRCCPLEKQKGDEGQHRTTAKS